MGQMLIEQFITVNRLYEEVIPKVEKAFLQLKQEEHEGLKELNEDIGLQSVELSQALQALTAQIEKECEEKNIPNKIPTLLTYYGVQEKESVLEQLHQAIANDRLYKSQMMMYRALAEIKYETTEALVEVWSMMAQENNVNGQLFINRKL